MIPADQPPAIVISQPAEAQAASAPADPNAQAQVQPTQGELTGAKPAAPAAPPAIAQGWRRRLAEKGILFNASYTSESAAVVTGGREGGAAYTQQLLASVAIDTGKVLGIEGGKFTFSVLHRKGEDLTANRIGNLFEVQELFGGGQDFRPAEISYEQKLNGGKTALKFGMYHTGDDFATISTGCNFQSFALCPRPTSLFYNSGFSGFPIPRWGLRARQELGGGVFLTVAAFEVNAFRAVTGSGWDLKPRFDSFVVPVELGWKSGQKEGGLPGLLRVGGLVDTTDKPDVRDDVNGNSYVLSGLSAATRKERWSVWVMGEKMVKRFGPGDRGLTIFGTVTQSDAHTARVTSFATAGFVAKGLFDSRPADTFGMGLIYGRVNPRTADKQRDQIALGQDVAVQTTETSAELFYGWQANRHLLIRPNLQYIHRVGATGQYPDALVAGLTVKAGL